MVRLFPPEDVIPEPEFRGIDHLPATALRSVVEQLFALPATVSYDLRQVSQALSAAGMVERSYRPAPAFKRPFSALLSIEISRALREGRADRVAVEEVRHDVSQRLHTILAIARWLEREHADRVAAGKRVPPRLAKRAARRVASGPTGRTCRRSVTATPPRGAPNEGSVRTRRRPRVWPFPDNCAAIAAAATPLTPPDAVA